MSDDFKVQWSVSLPPSAQYAKGDMLNIRGESVEEVEALFEAALDGSFINKATEVGALLRAAAVVSDGTTPAPDKGSPEKGDDAPVANIRRCEHGNREHKSGVTKSGKNAGKPWSGYFCPEKDRSKQCDPQWDD